MWNCGDFNITKQKTLNGRSPWIVKVVEWTIFGQQEKVKVRDILRDMYKVDKEKKKFFEQDFPSCREEEKKEK